jgi:predicted ATPase/class 3 adenylate cyclase
MIELPTGTVTFLFTDLEGSTRLWEQFPDAMKEALARHDEILRDAITSHGGVIVKTTGDGAHAAFGEAGSAVNAALHAQRAVATEDWTAVGGLRVRMGIHSGPAEVRAGDYYGTAVNRAARLMSAAHGGQVIVSLATEELVRDDLDEGVSVLDLGELRLRDLSRAERVYQLCADGLAADFPPLRSLDAYAGNLPVQLTSFVGRDDELHTVAQALRDARLVTLTGVGGVGKTRVAVQAAAELLPELPDGAWFCELARATDGDSLVQIVAATLGVPPRPGTSLDGSIVDFLRAKRALLVLDNCEHLLDDAAALAERIIQGCPHVRVLATSREGLAVAGEHVRPLRSLDSSWAEALFVERAKTVVPTFTTNEATTRAVGEICRRLDGIPLAIELAAARAEVMSAVEIAQLLDERFRLLTGGRRTAVERHQTLRATVDWSYSMLDDVDRAVFERLAVFAGSFDARAAAAVVSGEGIEEWDVRDALGRLVRRSMVVADVTADGITRYSMLETLRQYARERLDERGEADEWRRRHARHYANFAHEIHPELLSANELDARARLREELDNLRAAFNWGLDRDDDADVVLAIRIVAELGIEASAHVASGIGMWAERALTIVEHSTAGLRHAVLGAAAYTVMQSRGDPEGARDLADSALRHGVPSDSANPLLAHQARAMAEGYLGSWERGIALLDGWVATASDADPYFVSAYHGSKAAMLATSGHSTEAGVEAAIALERAREIGNPTCLTLALFTLAWAEWERQPETALAAVEESIALSRAGAVDGGLGTALGLAARIRMQMGDSRGAWTALREAIEYSRDVGDVANLGFVLFELAHYLAGDDDAFAAQLGVALNEGALRRLLMQVGGDEVARRQETLDRARERLDASAFAAVHASGMAMTRDDVIEFALAKLDDLLASQPSHHEPASPT